MGLVLWSAVAYHFGEELVYPGRKELKKEDCTIYGIASDGYDFVFLKIDDYSKTTTRDGNYDEIIGVLVHMFTKAAVMSPTHSKSHPESSKPRTSLHKLSVQEDVEVTG
ncbi:hypothetical protein PENFLA_c009G02054 [Penicillium flavigenum]|uniref:Uncharacterized protein n=1 Tax=Penicillium flavigenum TaxID=254877 RepID=A0A1V6TEZ7_9EURO|nr:hypothetical protein PENFLA_c009G02054 [Penicillium flavigenum]